MILDELPTELLPLVYRHIPGDFLWTNVRPVCRRMNNNIRRNEYWQCRLSELYGLQLAPRLTATAGDGRQPNAKAAEDQQRELENLMPALRCVAVERRALSRPFDKRTDETVHIGTIDALRLFRCPGTSEDGPIFCLSGARDRQITLRKCQCDEVPSSASSSNDNNGPVNEIARIDNAHTGWIWCISVAPDGCQFYSAGWDAQIQQWHFAESRIERGLALNFPSLAALWCVLEDQNVLYASTYKRGPILFDLRAGTHPQHELNVHNNFPVFELATGPNCNQLFSIGEDNRLVSVDKRRFSVHISVNLFFVRPIFQFILPLLKFHCHSHVDYADGHLCLSLRNGQLRFFDPGTLQMENQLTVTETDQGPYNIVKLTRGATFCANKCDNMLRMYTPGLRPRLMASTKLDANVTRLDVLDGAVVAALSTGALAYFFSR
ncbi:hypothetical protein niasHT_024006 [Heterodera trifolii]|uniref:F-box domain-containing protein n=1 Tax=Heterodera trifolii TaxID=157864 RepID=A0ABD2KPC4_9BILA